jgi:hypothetical protein
LRIHHERCPLCKTPYEDSPNDPTRYVDTCIPCDRGEKTFEKRFGFGGDSDFYHHELAHFVLRYGTRPRYRRDLQWMEEDLYKQTAGRAQLHELRVLALQGLAYVKLGWRASWKRLVHLSWGGLDEAAKRNGQEGYLRGEPVVRTETAALREVLRYRATTSQTKVALLAQTISLFRTGGLK